MSPSVLRPRIIQAGLFFLTIFLFVAVAPVAKAAAPEQIISFSSLAEIQPTGEVLISETIVYDFSEEERHGIFRKITLISKDGPNIDIEIRSVADELGNEYPYSTSRGGQELSLKIGDPNRTITGQHTYVLTYLVRGGLRYFEDYAEFYWNITGSDWNVPILRAEASVLLPSSVELDRLQYRCYLGQVGSTSTCTVLGFEPGASATRAIMFQNSTLLSPGEGMTVAVGFPKGLAAFQVITPVSVAPAASEPPKIFTNSFNWVFSILFLVILGLFLSRLIKFVRGKEDLRVRADMSGEISGKPVVVEYEPPTGLSPVDLGVMIDRVFGPSDLAAGVIYLAEQGYLRIKYLVTEIPFWPDKKDYELIRLKDGSDLKDPALKELLDYLFNSSQGQPVRISDFSKKAEKNFLFMKSVQAVAKNYLVSIGLMKEESWWNRVKPQVGNLSAYSSKRQQVFLWVGMIFLILILGFVFDFSIWITFIILAVGSVFALAPQEKFTPTGLDVFGKLMGFRKFLQMTEKDRLELMNAPARKPELFERFLPYAIALGVVSEWAKQFESLTLPPPAWMDGYPAGAFNAAVFANSASSFSSSFASSLSPAGTASAFGGGGGGGGFSGGGGGGGGGGSW